MGKQQTQFNFKSDFKFFPFFWKLNYPTEQTKRMQTEGTWNIQKQIKFSDLIGT